MLILSSGLQANTMDEDAKISFDRIVEFSTKNGKVELTLSQVYALFFRHRLYSTTGIQVEKIEMENDNQVRIFSPSLRHRGNDYPIHFDNATVDRICARIGMKLVTDSAISKNNFDDTKRFLVGSSPYYSSLKANVIINSKLEVESLEEAGTHVSSTSGVLINSFSCRF